MTTSLLTACLRNLQPAPVADCAVEPDGVVVVHEASHEGTSLIERGWLARRAALNIHRSLIFG
jgi:type II secretory pathway component PulL